MSMNLLFFFNEPWYQKIGPNLGVCLIHECVLYMRQYGHVCATGHNSTSSPTSMQRTCVRVRCCVRARLSASMADNCRNFCENVTCCLCAFCARRLSSACVYTAVIVLLWLSFTRKICSQKSLFFTHWSEHFACFISLSNANLITPKSSGAYQLQTWSGLPLSSGGRYKTCSPNIVWLSVSFACVAVLGLNGVKVLRDLA